METKVIALDIYGTVLSSSDFENIMPPRKGFDKFVKKALEDKIYLVTISDAAIKNLLLDLDAAFERSVFNWKIFSDFYELKTYPKDVSVILLDYNLKPSQLFVIGDSYGRDLKYAKELGCSICLVPEYTQGDKFDFSSIKIP